MNDLIFGIPPVSAEGLDNIIEMPEEFASGVMEATGTLFTDLWVIIALVIGVPLAFYVIRRVIALLPKGK